MLAFSYILVYFKHGCPRSGRDSPHKDKGSRCLHLCSSHLHNTSRMKEPPLWKINAFLINAQVAMFYLLHQSRLVCSERYIFLHRDVRYLDNTMEIKLTVSYWKWGHVSHEITITLKLPKWIIYTFIIVLYVCIVKIVVVTYSLFDLWRYCRIFEKNTFRNWRMNSYFKYTNRYNFCFYIHYLCTLILIKARIPYYHRSAVLESNAK